MNETLWQVIGVLVALVAIGSALTFVFNATTTDYVSPCEDACDFLGWQCRSDTLAEVCEDDDYDGCKEYRVIACDSKCDSITGLCENG